MVRELRAPGRPVVGDVVTPQVELAPDALGLEQPGEAARGLERAGRVLPLALPAQAAWLRPRVAGAPSGPGSTSGSGSPGRAGPDGPARPWNSPASPPAPERGRGGFPATVIRQQPRQVRIERVAPVRVVVQVGHLGEVRVVALGGERVRHQTVVLDVLLLGAAGHRHRHRLVERRRAQDTAGRTARSARSAETRTRAGRSGERRSSRLEEQAGEHARPASAGPGASPAPRGSRPCPTGAPATATCARSAGQDPVAQRPAVGGRGGVPLVALPGAAARRGTAASAPRSIIAPAYRVRAASASYSGPSWATSSGSSPSHGDQMPTRASRPSTRIPSGSRRPATPACSSHAGGRYQRPRQHRLLPERAGGALRIARKTAIEARASCRCC